MSIRDEVLADTRPLGFKDVEVPEWRGRVVRVPELDALEWIGLADAAVADRAVPDQPTKREIAIESARIVAGALRDPETGERVFGDSDVDMLVRRHPKVVNRLFLVFAEVNGVGGKEQAAAAGKSVAAAPAATPTS